MYLYIRSVETITEAQTCRSGYRFTVFLVNIYKICAICIGVFSSEDIYMLVFHLTKTENNNINTCFKL